jgi:serine/threonine protein kinase
LEPFPGYRLTDFLGRGGWGEVWKATRPDGPAVALKFLPCDSHLAAAQEVRGLQSIRQLQHPHLIHIERIWCFGGHIVIAMELAEGSLLDLLGVYHNEFGAGIIPEHLCHFLGQVAAALDFLNTRQHNLSGQRVAVRHCDVKPSNVLLVGGTVKLSDFSLAVQTTAPIWYHRKVGTLGYAAPEIFHGQLSDRTDQYALAVTYCQLRGGRLPFKDNPSRFRTNFVRSAPDLSSLTPPEKSIIMRALDGIPQNRWPSCTEMISRLARLFAPAAALPPQAALSSPGHDCPAVTHQGAEGSHSPI